MLAKLKENSGLIALVLSIVAIWLVFYHHHPSASGCPAKIC